MSNRNTKSALLLSVMSMLLCIAMLAGSTFAWFTDTATSGSNKIVAGNLDVKVEYTKDNGTTWTDMEGSTSLFSNSVWEPGYTEYVTLKITNAGSLAFKYKVLVTPVSENGGVNVNGDSFKLSDYLVFGTTAASETFTQYTRDTARAAVGTTTGLTVDNLVKSNTMLGKDTAGYKAQYITLVVYMPESVGNAANYKTGTEAPYINLGIQVVATQINNESDSFGTDYDTNAAGAYTCNPAYNYYPQVVVTAAKAASGDTTLVKVQENVQYAKATVPADAVAEGTTSLTLTVVPKTATATTQQTEGVKAEIEDDNREIANFDVKITGIDSENTTPIPVEIYVGKGLSNVKVYHNGTLISGTTYDAESGIVSFETTSFSDYTVAYDIDKWTNHAATSFATAVDETKKIVTIASAAELALFANTATTYNGYTVNLVADIDLGEYLWTSISYWKGTFNGNGHTISNMIIKENAATYSAFFATFDGTIKDVTFKGASVTGQRCGVVVEYTKGEKVELDNVSVLNSVINGVKKNAALIGFASGRDNGGCQNVTVKNCTVDSVIFGDDLGKDTAWQCGAIIGYTFHQQNITVTGNTVKNVSIETDPADAYPSEEQYASHPLIGSLNAGSSRYDCSNYTVIIKGNTVTGCTGFATGTTATAYCGGHSDYTSVYSAKIVVDDVLVAGSWAAHAASAFSNIDADAKTITVMSAAELALVSKNAKSLVGYTVTLGADIDLADYLWAPISITYNKAFTFDGAGYTISNLTINTTDRTVGLFADATGATIKNVNMVNVKIVGCERVGAICGTMIAGSIDNCTVTGAVITATPVWESETMSYVGAAKAGGIAGYLSNENTAPATNCKVKNATITAYRDAGGIVGAAMGGIDLSNSTVEDSTITIVAITPYELTKENAPSANVGEIYGRCDTTPTTTGSTVNNVTTSSK